ncbi:MAG: ATP-binding protein [Promethearchaeota archaeon]
MSVKLGTVFNFGQLPDVSKFPFVINKSNKGFLVRKGQFVHTHSEEGYLIGVIERILLLNEYFADALTIKAYTNNNNPNILRGLFPTEEFESAIAIVNCLGIIEFEDNGKEKNIKKIKRMSYPATPGAGVFLVEEEILNRFLGLDTIHGLHIGTIKGTTHEVKISMDRLLSKHFAILSISGGGKSYLTSILIEELLSREEELGTPAIILIDVHGEYSYLEQIQALREKVHVQDISYFQIAVPKLNAWSFKKYHSQISNVQVRELSKYLENLKKDKELKGIFSLPHVIEQIENDSGGNKNTKQALIGWLEELNRLNLFGGQENPNMKALLKQGEITIFSFQQEINLRKKQIILDYISNRLFYLRRVDKIPPFLLIIEEAHQFCPEAAESKAISKSIIETIAREGRKFMACLCLISQRPKKLSTTVLSQCNSKMILNIKNPHDLKHLMDSSEAITREHANLISSLGVGEVLLMGNAVNHPIFIEVRERKYPSSLESISLSITCAKWTRINN